jgi:hypothetical protein
MCFAVEYSVGLLDGRLSNRLGRWLIVSAAPSGVLPIVVTVRVELPEPVVAAGLKDAMAPAGNPFAPRLTVPVNPFTAPTATV